MKLAIKKYLLPVIALLLTLAACGGVSVGGSSATPDDHHIVDGATRFTRFGLDLDPTGNRVGGELGATIDANANITFKTAFAENQNYPYFFTFASGLPGGSVTSQLLYTTTLPGQNKTVSLLAPNLTKNVQNVFWSNLTDPDTYGFASAGYLLNPSKIGWPAFGSDSYQGQAYQYVVDQYIDGRANGYALYTSSVSVALDYGSRTMTISIAPGTRQSLSGNSTMSDISSRLIGAIFNLTNLNFSGGYLGYQVNPDQQNGWGLAFAGDHQVNFYGENAQELAGILTYHSDRYNPDTWETISFAALRQ